MNSPSKLLQNGLATLPDVLEARSATAQAEYDLQSARGAEVIARGDLATTLGPIPIRKPPTTAPANRGFTAVRACAYRFIVISLFQLQLSQKVLREAEGVCSAPPLFGSCENFRCEFQFSGA